jgi:hypothetical protein
LSKTPIEFVSVSIKGKNVGNYTDSNGHFLLMDLSQEDTLIVKHMNYEKKAIPVDIIQNNMIIFLNPIFTNLNEVIVYPNKEKSLNVGYSKYKSSSSFKAFNGFEITTLIMDEIYFDRYIKAIIIKTKNNSSDPCFSRLHLYENNNGFPGKEILLKSDQLVTSSKNVIEIVFPIRNSFIKFPEKGIFVGIEWVNNIEGQEIIEPQISVKNMKKCSLTYYRFWDFPWKKFSDLIGQKNIQVLIGINIE